jgi:hypothetical protein
MPPTKFKASGKKRLKDPNTGKSTNTWIEEHYYIKSIPRDELFKALNNDNTKPKVKAKIRNELVRRGPSRDELVRRGVYKSVEV